MNKQDNFLVNFSLKGYSSIQIGLYLLIAAYVIKSMLDGFLIDDNPMGMMSAQIIEVLGFVVIFLTFFFSSLALFFKGRRKAKKQNYLLWNSKTKKRFWLYLLNFSILFFVLVFLSNTSYTNYITPTFLLIYGLFLSLLEKKKDKTLYVLSGVTFLLAILVFFIPNYWYSSIYILGVAHITYGIVVKE
ncbi:hypothetical protein [uncultured Polaribacter sp.]|uniref:hypothetical protein n=1 Tax=uncultured Polaribacter sp. TaxID=174711 RepID=UPI00262CB8D6|nr:hypothetical protein [uncultured Polaribacter sp.]